MSPAAGGTKFSARTAIPPGTICAVTDELAPADEPFLRTVMLHQVLMADHQEEILNHLSTLDYTDLDIAKACTLLPYHQASHKLDNESKIAQPAFVSEMFTDVIVALAMQTTAEDKTVQLVGPTPGQITDLAARPQHESGDPHPRFDAPPESLGGTMCFRRRGIYAHHNAPHSLGSIFCASTPVSALSTRKAAEPRELDIKNESSVCELP